MEVRHLACQRQGWRPLLGGRWIAEDYNRIIHNSTWRRLRLRFWLWLRRLQLVWWIRFWPLLSLQSMMCEVGKQPSSGWRSRGLKLHGFTWNCMGSTFKLYNSDRLGLVKVSDNDIPWTRVQFWKKIALTTVQIALDFASCNFPVAVQFLPKSHSHPCDYLYVLCNFKI